MSGCGFFCFLFIWAVFLFPILVSICCLIVKREKIFYKLKYFFISSFVGYVWVAIFTTFRNILQSNEAINKKWYSLLLEYPNTLMTIDLALHIVPILILSYLLSKNKIVDFGKSK